MFSIYDTDPAKQTTHIIENHEKLKKRQKLLEIKFKKNMLTKNNPLTGLNIELTDITFKFIMRQLLLFYSLLSIHGGH